MTGEEIKEKFTEGYCGNNVDVVMDNCSRFKINNMELIHIYDGEDYFEIHISNKPYWKMPLKDKIGFLFDKIIRR